MMVKSRNLSDMSISMGYMKQFCKGIFCVSLVFFSVAMNVILVVCQSLYSCFKASLQL